MMGRRGLFGRNMGFQTPGIGDGLPGMPERVPDMVNVPTTAGGMFGDPMARPTEQGPQGFWQGGKKFTGRDAIAGVLAAVGDGLSRHYGGAGGAVQGLLQSRMLPQFQAAQLAAEQRQRAAELADFERKQQIEAQYRAPKVNDTIADFEWYKNLSPEDRALYEQMRPVYRQGADGQFYRVQTSQQPQGYDALPEGYTIRGGGTGGNVGGNFR